MEDETVFTGPWTFKCRACGTDNSTDRIDKKVCVTCALNHDGLTKEEQKDADALALAAKDDGISEGEEKAKVKAKKTQK